MKRTPDTTFEVLWYTIECMARAWNAPDLQATAKVVLAKTDPNRSMYWFETPYMKLTVQSPRYADSKKSWTTMKLQFSDELEREEGPELGEIKWALLPDGSLAQLYCATRGWGRSHKFYPCLTWADVEKDLAETWKNAEQVWKGFTAKKPEVLTTTQSLTMEPAEKQVFEIRCCEEL